MPATFLQHYLPYLGGEIHTYDCPSPSLSPSSSLCLSLPLSTFFSILLYSSTSLLSSPPPSPSLLSTRVALEGVAKGVGVSRRGRVPGVPLSRHCLVRGHLQRCPPQPRIPPVILCLPRLRWSQVSELYHCRGVYTDIYVYVYVSERGIFWRIVSCLRWDSSPQHSVH